VCVPLTPVFLALPFGREVRFRKLRAVVEAIGHAIPVLDRGRGGIGQSMTLGWSLRGRPLRANAMFPALEHALATWSVVAQERGSAIGWAFQVNRNYVIGPHTDAGNGGFSIGSVWGRINGGELCIRGCGAFEVNGRHLIFDGHQSHWVLPFQPLDDNAHRYAIIEFRFRDDCPEAEQQLESDRLTRRGQRHEKEGVLTRLLKMSSVVPPRVTAHLELKQVARSTIRPEALHLAVRSQCCVEYLLEPYWRTVCADIAYRSPMLHSPLYALNQVRLSASQVRSAIERGLCEKVNAADLPAPFVSFL